jgi:hypothetical protein
MTLSEDERRVLALWAAECAERTTRLFEERARATHAIAIPSPATGPSPEARCASVRCALSALPHSAAQFLGTAFMLAPMAIAAAWVTFCMSRK